MLLLMFFSSATKQSRDDEESIGKPLSKALLSKCYRYIYMYKEKKSHFYANFSIHLQANVTHYS